MRKIDTRANGDLTRTKIFAAAKKLFPLYGFKGTSTQMLAAKAGVNEALIFHHFKNKEELWKKTKQAILEENTNQGTATILGDLGTQLEKMIKDRFDMYDRSRELVRMLQWQRLENKKERIQGGNQGSPEYWVEIFKQLQKENKMRPDIDPTLATIMIANAVSGALMDDHAIFKDPAKKQEYVDLLAKTFMGTLRS